MPNPNPNPKGWLATFRDLDVGHIEELEEFREGMYSFIEEVSQLESTLLIHPTLRIHSGGQLALALPVEGNANVVCR